MHKFIYTLVLALGLSSTMQALEPSQDTHLKQQRSQNNSVSKSYASYYSKCVQLGIGPNQIVKLTEEAINNNKRFKLTNNNGFKIPFHGNYLISYRVIVNSQSSIALYKNEEIIPESAFSNASINPVFGNVIIHLEKNDVVTIRNIDISKTFNTVVPVSTLIPTCPVSVTVQYLGQ